MEETGWNKTGNDEALSAIPLEKRQHWLTPAMIFGGLEFTIPVLMVGATLVGAFGLSSIFWILVVSLLVFQWVGNAVAGYMGAKTGRSSSVIARTSFGAHQARFIVGLTIFIVSLGWWAVQTAVAGMPYPPCLALIMNGIYSHGELLPSLPGCCLPFLPLLVTVP